MTVKENKKGKNRLKQYILSEVLYILKVARVQSHKGQIALLGQKHLLAHIPIDLKALMGLDILALLLDQKNHIVQVSQDIQLAQDQIDLRVLWIQNTLKVLSHIGPEVLEIQKDHRARNLIGLRVLPILALTALNLTDHTVQQIHDHRVQSLIELVLYILHLRVRQI